MSVSFRPGFTFVICKNGDKKDIANYRPSHYKIYTTILKIRIQNTLDAITGEKKSATIKKNYITHTFYYMRHNRYV